MQQSIPGLERPGPAITPFKHQLLKWIGNKQRFASEIVSYFPSSFGTYYEPFLGSGAILGTLAPRRAVASDALRPLIDLWQLVGDDPSLVTAAYARRWRLFEADRDKAYAAIRARYNRKPNAHDLFFLSRSCYGGVIRFRKDGFMSTPIGAHRPVPPEGVRARVKLWRERIAGTKFDCCDFESTMARAKDGDLIYCDPPYSDSQGILYGAQAFSLKRLFRAIHGAKDRGAFVALSIDGHKKSGSRDCEVPVPDGLFERCAVVNCGRSMLKRFQMSGRSLESEVVADRLYLTW